jgi:hypothetical protein
MALASEEPVTVTESLEYDHADALTLLDKAHAEIESSEGARGPSFFTVARLVRVHLLVEERVLLPAVTLAADDARRIRREHGAIRALFREIDDEIARGDWLAAVGDLAELRATLDAHHRFEAERVYPWFARALEGPDAARLAALAAQERDPEIREVLDRASPEP